eukprot:CFRG7774T1
MVNLALNGTSSKSGPQVVVSVDMYEFGEDDAEGVPRSGSGYHLFSFEKKNDQMQTVCHIIKAMNTIPAKKIDSEVRWFYEYLGIDDKFFYYNPPDKIAEFIVSIYGAKLISTSSRGEDEESAAGMDINLKSESDGISIYLCPSEPGVSIEEGPQIEERIDHKFLDTRPSGKSYRVETYRSKGAISLEHTSQLRCYFVEQVRFLHENADEQETDIALIADTNLLSRATDRTLAIYQKLIHTAVHRTGPVSLWSKGKRNAEEYWLHTAYRSGSAPAFFSNLSYLYHFYDLYSTRKYVEQFSNGMVIVSLCLVRLPNSDAPDIEECLLQMVREISLLYLLPVSSMHQLFIRKQLTVRETTYAYCGWRFAEHFMNRLGPEYTVLNDVLSRAENEVNMSLLTKLKTRLRQDTYGKNQLKDIVQKHPTLVKILFQHFASTHRLTPSDQGTHLPSPKGSGHQSPCYGSRKEKYSLSSEKLQIKPSQVKSFHTVEEIENIIRRMADSPASEQVFLTLLTFNQHILKTNFFQPTKVALSFRLDPSFLPEIEYPTKPFGIFFILGREFRGFQVRFVDVARGGVRIIRSPNVEAHRRNVLSQFDENYNLALTQQLKNKDIPEGGSKGTILLGPDFQGDGISAFKKYVDALLDLLLVGASPGIKDVLVDRHNQKEILFLGPDEGTADLMDWASHHARKRAAPFWKAFTTGKGADRGGIPHDRFGMTTRSVHQYVLGILEKEGIEESEVTKFQTGGPDGDLGSNEILISKDKTTAIVDGSGVLCDPSGIDREELTRLAHSRLMISHFDSSKLGPEGFKVLVEDREVTLPDGSLVENGFQFRNLFHLHPLASATLFVPCGGRPEAIDALNVSGLLGDKETSPNFKYIVEGANLFITQHARTRLEKHDVIVFKDASTNKGGVTSSSLEVLSGLALTDDEYLKHMCTKDGVEPSFYREYVVDIQNIIEENARLEFNCIWNEAERTGKSRIQVADLLSNMISSMQIQLMQSSLFDNEKLRKIVLEEYCPAITKPARWYR